ncbi:MAG: cell wall hydrolase [Bacteriophage sp.]|nr:MAG: cell wall hydrolase [Bacteriophage sp.]
MKIKKAKVRRFIEMLLTIGILIFSGACLVFGVCAISEDFNEVENVEVTYPQDSRYSRILSTTSTTEVITTTHIITTTSITTTSTETSLTSPTTTITTTCTEIISDEVEEPKNDPVEPENDYAEFEEVGTEEVEYNGITQQEYDMLVLTVYLEAGNQTLDCKKAVASVVLNRVNHSDFPSTVYSVLTQENQFTINFNRTDTPGAECYEAVDSVLEYGSILPPDVLYFFADYCNNSWLWSREQYIKYGNTIFAY